MSRYSQTELSLLKALHTTGSTPFDLAGHWYFERKTSGLGRLPKPVVAPDIFILVSKSWTVATGMPFLKESPGAQQQTPATAPVTAGGIRNQLAALLVSALLWEALFPQECSRYGVIARTKQNGLNELDFSSLDLFLAIQSGDDWMARHMAWGRDLRTAVSDLFLADCCRIAGPEGAAIIPIFERELETGKNRPIPG